MCVESEVSENRVKKEKCEDPTLFCQGADNCSLKKRKKKKKRTILPRYFATLPHLIDYALKRD